MGIVRPGHFSKLFEEGPWQSMDHASYSSTKNLRSKQNEFLAPQQAHRALVALWMVVLLAGINDAVGADTRLSPAQEQARQKAEQCSKATTPQQCKLLLPGCERAALWIEKAAAADLPATATVLDGVAYCHQQLGHFSEAELLYRRAVERKERVLGVCDPGVATSLDNLAVLYYLGEKYDEAEPLLVRARAIWEKTPNLHRSDAALSLMNLAAVYHAQGKLAQAEPLHVRALQVLEQELGKEHPDLAAALNSLAMLYQSQAKYGTAEALLLRAKMILEKNSGPDHPDVVLLLNNLAWGYQAQGKLGQAEPLYLRALKIQEQARDSDQPELAKFLMNLASLYQAQGKFEQAAPLYLRALRIVETNQRPGNSNLARVTLGLSNLYRAQGRLTQALPFRTQSVKIMESQAANQCMSATTAEQCERALPACEMAATMVAQEKGATSSATATLLYYWAQCHAQIVYDSTSSVEAMTRFALAVAKPVPKSMQSKVASSSNPTEQDEEQRTYRAEIYSASKSLLELQQAQLAHIARAEELYRSALAIREHALGPEHPAVGRSLAGLARLFLTLGRLDAAEPLFLRALKIQETWLGPEHPDVAAFSSHLGMLYLAEGRAEKAEPLYARALQIYEKAFGPEHPFVGTLLTHLAFLYQGQGQQVDKAPALFLRARQISEKLWGPDDPRVAQDLIYLSESYRTQGKPAEAEPLRARALQILDRPAIAECDQADTVQQCERALPACVHAALRVEQDKGAHDPATFNALYNLAYCRQQLAHDSIAEPLYQRLLALEKKALGPDHPELVKVMYRLAELYQMQHRYEEATPLLLQVVKIQEKALGPEHPELAAALNRLAILKYAQGQYVSRLTNWTPVAYFDAIFPVFYKFIRYVTKINYEQTEQLLLQSIKIQEKNLNVNHSDLTALLSNLAHIYQGQDKTDQAKVLYDRALKSEEAATPDENENLYISATELAGTHRVQGKNRRNLFIYESRLFYDYDLNHIQPPLSQFDVPQIIICLSELASLHERNGNITKATELYFRAWRILATKFGLDNPSAKNLRNNLDALFANSQMSDQAETLFSRALQVQEKMLGPDHPELVPALFRLATLYQRQKRYVQAEPLLLRARQIQENTLGPDHIEVARSLIDLARLYRAATKYDQAETVLLRALQRQKSRPGREPPEVTPYLNNLALIYSDQGKLGPAEALYLRALQIQEKAHGREHPEVALALERLAMLYQKKEETTKAESLLLRAIQIQEQEPAKDQFEILNSEQARAIPIYRRSMQIESSHIGALQLQDPAPAVNFDGDMSAQQQLVALYLQKGWFARSESLLLQALQSKKNLPVRQSNWISHSIGELSDLYIQQGKEEQAESLLLHAVQTADSSQSRASDTAFVLLPKLAELYAAQGKDDKADPIQMRISENSYRGSLRKTPEFYFIDFASTLFNRIKLILHGKFELLLSTEQQCDQAETVEQCLIALPACELEAAKIESEKSDNNIAAAQTFYNLAYCHDLLNTDFFRHKSSHGLKAKRLLRRAIEIKQRVLGLDHPEVAAWLNELGELYARSGKVELAEMLYLPALQIRGKTLDPFAPEVAASLSHVAGLYHREGKYEQAELLYLRVLKIWEKVLGPEHPQSVRVRSLLVGLYLDQKRYDDLKLLHLSAPELEELYQASRSLKEQKSLAHPDAVISSHTLAKLYPELDKYEQRDFRDLATNTFSLPAWRQENSLSNWIMHWGRINSIENYGSEISPWLRLLWVVIHKKQIGGLSQLPGAYLGSKTMQCQILSMFHQAEASWQEASLRFLSDSSFDTIRGATEADVRAMYRDDRLANEGVYARFYDDPSQPYIGKLALATALLNKGRATDVGAWASRVLHQGQASAAQRLLFGRLQQSRQQYEFLLYRGPGPLASAEYQHQLRSLLLTADELEGQIVAEQVRMHQVLPKLPEQILSAVAHHLPASGALVEIVRVNQCRYDGSRYLAMLLFPDQRIEVIDLGKSAILEAAMTDFLVAVQNRSVDPRSASQALYQKVFSSLRDKLGATKKLYLSLDGLLNLVPFDALHDGKDYLLGQYEFNYLTSGRDLLREPVDAPAQPPLILADPDFQTSLPSPERTAPPGAPVFAASPPTLYQQIKGIARLPGTRSEATALQQLLKVPPLLGAAATEEAVHSAHGPVVLHIASHGFLLEDSTLSSENLMGSRQAVLRHAALVGLEESSAHPQPQDDATALNRSVLLLAGAENAEQALDSSHDGLLSAAEVQSLDLWGTQLVVLSACDTGKGAVSTGQGIYGLRSAFLVAGAETLVTSLWPVADRITSELMTSYYRKLVQGGKPRVGAMEEAMQEMKNKHPHPYYWAPFIVIGQDGPLRSVLGTKGRLGQQPSAVALSSRPAP